MKERQKLALLVSAASLAFSASACKLGSSPALEKEETPQVQEITPQELIALEERLNEKSPTSNFQVSPNNNGELALYSEFGDERWEHGELRENKEGEWVIKGYVGEGAVEIEVDKLSASEKAGLLKIETTKPGDKDSTLIPYLTIPLP